VVEAEAEFVTGDGAFGETVLRLEIRAEAGGVEPVFEGIDPAAVAVGVAVPEVLEGGDFAEAGAAACGERKRGIRADGDVEDGVRLAEFVRYFEAGGGSSRSAPRA
jgi:hypothetical protein